MLFLLLQTADTVTLLFIFGTEEESIWSFWAIGIRIRIVEVAACLLFGDKWHQTNVFAENSSFIIW